MEHPTELVVPRDFHHVHLLHARAVRRAWFALFFKARILFYQAGITTL